MTTPSKDGFAVFEQDGNKCPILHHGKLSAEIFRDFVTGCRNYVTNKEIAAEKQTIKVMTALKGYIWEDWVSVHYDELKALSLTDFLQRPSPTSSSASRMLSCLPSGKPMSVSS